MDTNTNTIRKQVLIYARISPTDRLDGISIENQIDKMEWYCKYKEYDIVKVFIDKGISGKETESRSGYNEMIEYALDKDNDIEAILCYRCDRMHRSLKNLLIMTQDILTPNNIGFISVTEEFDTSTAIGRLFLNMIGSFSEFEREMIIERTSNGVKQRVNSGRMGGGIPPFGYGYNKDTKDVYINSHQAKVVNDIFNKRVGGLSLREIATELNDDIYYNNNINAYGGKRKVWSAQTIREVLCNEFYIGNIIYKIKGADNKSSEIIKSIGIHRPIISITLWNNVININKSNNTRKTKCK